MQELSIMNTFVENLKKAMKAAGINQRQLSELVGIHTANISRLLHSSNTSIKTLSRIADAAGYPVHALLDPKFQPSEIKEKTTAA
jgi:transcriptional regulator with XRE-family HTH domain